MAALSVLCFFRYRRLGDLVKVRVDDITHVGDNIEIFLRRHKTDGENQVAQCTIVGRGRAFQHPGFSRGVHHPHGANKGAVLVPQELGEGGQGVAVAYSWMYQVQECVS